ncbi:hypothetical protein NBO_39g0001 [Nosema bombycis CQ1]|uniref:Uncharacterized protein n=1 Tax=Nosema bombycis (strain CQ1 / CVCC 102059) TaxID=578461 RepID=R0MMJ9_NOSB1|nr:hypothetical protein NBO_39g0001 [Nosema bombycis CQ1]|eukprot:EOB14088.1 hypothetical protein NBO_39g0001 [Nosema bombycis CQ1]
MEIYRSRNEDRCIRVVYEQYMQDYLRYYRVETPAPIYFNYKQLGANNISTFMKENEGLKSLNYFIEENFLKDRGKKFPYYSLLMYVKGQLPMEDEYLVNLLYSIFKYHGINVEWLYRLKPVINRNIMVEIDLKDLKTSGVNANKALQNKFEDYLKAKNVDTLVRKKVRWTTPEHIRFVNGIVKYCANKSFINIYNDLVYGGFLTRPPKNNINDG